VEERGHQHHTVLHKLDLMDKKLEAICKSVYDIDIIVMDPKDIKHNPMAAIEHAQVSEGTPSKPIMIDEDIEEQEDTQ
jgi:hypothetical protein